MAKKKVRIYKDPNGKGEYRSKLKNFLFLAQEGNAPQQVAQQQAPQQQVAQQQQMSSAEQEQLLDYVYQSLNDDGTDPQTLYTTLTKQGMDPNLVKTVIELTIQKIVSEREEGDESTAMEQANRERDEAAMEEARVQQEQEEAAAAEDQLLVDEMNEDSSMSDMVTADDAVDEMIEEDLPKAQPGGSTYGRIIINNFLKPIRGGYKGMRKPISDKVLKERIIKIRKASGAPVTQRVIKSMMQKAKSGNPSKFVYATEQEFESSLNNFIKEKKVIDDIITKKKNIREAPEYVQEMIAAAESGAGAGGAGEKNWLDAIGQRIAGKADPDKKYAIERWYDRRSPRTQKVLKGAKNLGILGGVGYGGYSAYNNIMDKMNFENQLRDFEFSDEQREGNEIFYDEETIGEAMERMLKGDKSVDDRLILEDEFMEMNKQKGGLISKKQYVKQGLKNFKTGGQEINNETPWNVNNETGTREAQKNTLVNYAQTNVAKDQEKKRLEAEYDNMMAQQQQIYNPPMGEEITDMTNMQEEIPSAKFGGGRQRRMLRRATRPMRQMMRSGMMMPGVSEIDVTRSGIFGNPKEYSMTMDPAYSGLMGMMGNPMMMMQGMLSNMGMPYQYTVPFITQSNKENTTTKAEREVEMRNSIPDIEAEGMMASDYGGHDPVIGETLEAYFARTGRGGDEFMEAFSEEDITKTWSGDDWELSEAQFGGAKGRRLYKKLFSKVDDVKKPHTHKKFKKTGQNPDRTYVSDINKSSPLVQTQIEAAEAQFRSLPITEQAKNLDKIRKVIPDYEILNARQQQIFEGIKKDQFSNMQTGEFFTQSPVAGMTENTRIARTIQEMSDAGKLKSSYGPSNQSVSSVVGDQSALVNVPSGAGGFEDFINIQRQAQGIPADRGYTIMGGPNAGQFGNVTFDPFAYGGFTDEASGLNKFIYGGDEDMYKEGGFPDLTGDGEVTQADILKGRGVYEYGGELDEYQKAGATQFTASGAGLKEDPELGMMSPTQKVQDQRAATAGYTDARLKQQQQQMMQRMMQQMQGRGMRQNYPSMGRGRNLFGNMMSANPAFSYAGSYAQPIYNKRSGSPFMGMVPPGSNLQKLDVTKSGIFGRPKRWTATYGTGAPKLYGVGEDGLREEEQDSGSGFQRRSDRRANRLMSKYDKRDAKKYERNRRRSINQLGIDPGSYADDQARADADNLAYDEEMRKEQEAIDNFVDPIIGANEEAALLADDPNDLDLDAPVGDPYANEITFMTPRPGGTPIGEISTRNKVTNNQPIPPMMPTRPYDFPTGNRDIIPQRMPTRGPARVPSAPNRMPTRPMDMGNQELTERFTGVRNLMAPDTSPNMLGTGPSGGLNINTNPNPFIEGMGNPGSMAYGGPMIDEDIYMTEDEIRMFMQAGGVVEYI